MKNLLILGVVVGVSVFAYNTWFKKTDAETKNGVDSSSLNATYKRKLINPYTGKPYSNI